ncbi:MAG: alpha/beta fold hydrolase [Vicinamibacterales bacterium]
MLVATSTVSWAQVQTGVSATGIAYDISGTGEPIVFVHGFSLDRRMWDGQSDAFSARYHVVRSDLRGHGHSAPIGGPYTGYADLLSVLDAAGIERATLVGLSAGSELAINLALAHPARVSRLVLAAPGLGGYRGPALGWLQPVFDAAAAGDAVEAASLWLDTPLMALKGDRAADTAVKSMVMGNAGLWTSKRLEQPLSPPAVGRLSEVTCPVLVVVGADDQPHIHQIAEMIADGIRGARRIVIPGAGHLVNLDAPAAFNAALDSFLSLPPTP